MKDFTVSLKCAETMPPSLVGKKKVKEKGSWCKSPEAGVSLNQFDHSRVNDGIERSHGRGSQGADKGRDCKTLQTTVKILTLAEAKTIGF